MSLFIRSFTLTQILILQLTIHEGGGNGMSF